MTPAEFRAARVKKKLTQSELADYVGVSLRTIQRYENGDSETPVSIQEWLKSTTKVNIVNNDYIALEFIINSFDELMFFQVEISSKEGGFCVLRHIIACCNTIRISPCVKSISFYSRGDRIYTGSKYIKEDFFIDAGNQDWKKLAIEHYKEIMEISGIVHTVNIPELEAGQNEGVS